MMQVDSLGSFVPVFCMELIRTKRFLHTLHSCCLYEVQAVFYDSQILRAGTNTQKQDKVPVFICCIMYVMHVRYSISWKYCQYLWRCLPGVFVFQGIIGFKEMSSRCCARHKDAQSSLPLGNAKTVVVAVGQRFFNGNAVSPCEMQALPEQRSAISAATATHTHTHTKDITDKTLGNLFASLPYFFQT